MTAAEPPYLTIDGPRPLRYALTANQVSVGRTPDNDIHLDHPEVSRAHAKFVRQGSTMWLEDLGSSNGTLVNGRRLQGGVELRHGDRIVFAGIEATYHEGTAASTEPSLIPPLQTPGATPNRRDPPTLPSSLPGTDSGSAFPTFPPTQPGPSLSASSPPRPSTPGVPAPGPTSPSLDATNSPAPPPQAALERIGGGPVVLTQVETSVGRLPGNDIVLADDTFVSHWHARIAQQGDQFFVIDLGSSNGTYVNGQRVSQPMLLEPGDEILFGTTAYFFRRLTPVAKKRRKGAPGGAPRPGGPAGGTRT